MTSENEIERNPIKGALVISKADAAERQLRTAIWLWFHSFDPVPIHALACAALKILWRLHERHGTGYQTMRQRIIERVMPEKQKEFITILNATENFIKHADKDPFAFHSFSPSVTDLVLMDAGAALQALNGNLPLEAQAFQAYFLINNPRLMTDLDTPYQKVIAEARKYNHAASKPEFYRLFAEAYHSGPAKAAREQAELAKKTPGG